MTRPPDHDADHDAECQLTLVRRVLAGAPALRLAPTPTPGRRSYRAVPAPGDGVRVIASDEANRPQLELVIAREQYTGHAALIGEYMEMLLDALGVSAAVPETTSAAEAAPPSTTPRRGHLALVQ